ncbi:MAG: PhoH family protein [Candidatus Babeliaceae bacterium]
MAEKKIYILDTNVLVHDPQAFFSFEKAHVGIPIVALEELDQFKGENSQRGRNTREVIRYLDLLRERGSLATGIKLDNGGVLRVLFIPEKMKISLGLNPTEPDNQILLTALDMQSQGFDVRFISKDLNMRVKADVLGIQAFDYLKDSVAQDQFYKGWITIQVPSIQLKKEIPDDLLHLNKEYELTFNEFILVEARNNPHNYRLFRYIGQNQFKPVVLPQFKWPIEPRNPQQIMALDLMLDQSVQLVTLLGPAGTGKTFLALVAALHELLVKDEYEKILITRPVIPLGPDIGYLPGDIQEKLHSWMQPIYDNMDFIVHTANMGQQNGSIYREDHPDYHNDRKNKFKKREKLAHERGLPTLDELIKRGKISLEAITYMRGRSIPYQYIIIDEVQNLTPHEVKTLVSRVGEGSKIILAGDPYQIDSPYLDFSSNGLVVASQRFKGEKLAGTAFLETSERSELSKLAQLL